MLHQSSGWKINRVSYTLNIWYSLRQEIFTPFCYIPWLLFFVSKCLTHKQDCALECLLIKTSCIIRNICVLALHPYTNINNNLCSIKSVRAFRVVFNTLYNHFHQHKIYMIIITNLIVFWCCVDSAWDCVRGNYTSMTIIKDKKYF